MKFEKLENGTVSDVEKKYSEYWDKIDILKRSVETRDEKKSYVFYDGPIYANAMPGLHHMYAKEIKDTFCKYKTMQGYQVLRKIGLDTHGLPIEVNVEKKLGFKSKLDIEEYGIENFNKECHKATDTNIADVVRLTREMGQFIDCDHPYVTCDNEYIESEWWIIKKYADAGLLYHSNKVLPYCSRCGTELSANEVAQEYKEISVNTVYVPFKLKSEENTYALVWTTTPWTLLANVALCVNPKEDYVKVESEGKYYLIAKVLADKVVGEGNYKVVKEYKGKDLEYLEYEQLLPELEVDKKAFYITCADYVTMSDGTGIVHIAPAFGVDDNNVGKQYDLPTLNPVGTDGNYNAGPWEGRFVVDPELEVDIIKYLAHEGKLYKKEKIKHNYPHCWRCKTPLLYYAKPAWYIKTTAYKDEIIAANKKVNWYPSYVGEKRFANWLENLVDWCVSRNRYWGCPLPVWTCSCGHVHTVGSIEQLAKEAEEKIDVKTLDLHRPYVDNIHIKCPECGKSMERVSDVLDVWFDSGSMPFAQFHYPFENEDLFNKQFPADFIAEGVDQTRGWFYVLLVISTFLKGQSPFKNVLVNDMLLDAEGKKMSKSKGNIVEPFTTIKNYGADTIRFYLPYVSPVWTPLKFDMEGLKEIYSKYTSTFKNAYSFFEMYANADSIDPREYNIPVKKRELIDRWLISKLNLLIKNVTAAYEEYDLNKVTRLIVPFLNDDLSNWYIRSNRRRFWDSELTDSKKAVYLTTYEVLLALCKLCAPLTPFLTEEIYQKLTGKESVHLEEYPKYDEKLIDWEVIERMDLVRDICSLGRYAREEVNIKVRQPISKVMLPKDDKEKIGDLESVIKEELNVKQIEYLEDMSEYLEYVVKPNFKVLGKELGPKMKLLQEVISKLNSNDVNKINNGGLVVKLDSEDFTLTNENVLVTLKQKEGYASANTDKTCVILDTNLDEDLILEGLAREFVRTVQALRKDADFNITDHIKVYYNGTEKVKKMMDKFYDYVMGEVLGDELIVLEDEPVDALNDEKVVIKVEKVK